MHKWEFCQAHNVEWFNSIPTKIIFQILDIPTSFYEF
jgi:hypothetical protein